MNSFNQLWQFCPFSVVWLSGDLQFSVLVAVVDQLDIDDSGSPIPKWYSKFCTSENRSVPVNSGSGKDMPPYRCFAILVAWRLLSLIMLSCLEVCQRSFILLQVSYILKYFSKIFLNDIQGAGNILG